MIQLRVVDGCTVMCRGGVKVERGDPEMILDVGHRGRRTRLFRLNYYYS